MTATTYVTYNATQLLSFFVNGTRSDGTRFWHLVNDAPEDVRDLVLYLHDDELPNDWRYETIVNLLYALKQYERVDADVIYQIAEGEVSVYNNDLANWLAENTSRGEYVNDTIEQGLVASNADVFQLIGAGQGLAIEQMVRVLVDELELD